MLAFSWTYSREPKNHSWSRTMGPPNGANIVLARERLFGIGSGIIDGKACIEGGVTFVESFGTVPFVGSALGGYHHGRGGGATGVCGLCAVATANSSIASGE